MGESPDRSNRTAGAEENEAERTPEETGSAQPIDRVEPEESATPAPTDTPTRILRALDAEATEEASEESAGGSAGGAEPDQAGAEAEAGGAGEGDGAEEPEAAAEEVEESEEAGSSELEESPVESATRVLRAPSRPEPATDDEPAVEPEAEGGASAVDSATQILRVPAKPEAARPEPETEAEPKAEVESEGETEAENAAEDVAEDAAEVAAAEAPEAESAPAADADTDDDADDEADDSDDFEEEPPAVPAAAGPPAPRSIAEDETRAMSVFPPLPPSGGSGGSGGASPLSRSAAPAAAPARVPAGATAVAETPETTVEAMEVLAALSAKPMTPMRIALRRVRLWGTLLVLLVLVLGTVQLVRPLPQAKVQQTAAGSYAFEGGALALQWPVKGQAAVYVPGLGSMGHSGSGNPVPLASVTKMMTAYIVLRDHPLKKGEQGPTITVDQQAVNDYNTGKPGGESVQKVSVGEQLSEYQALQMLMIPSANNVARLLGRWDAGNDAAFVQKMQATAAQLGMTRSVYTDPSGLTASTQSTADDQLKLAVAAMADPVFREVVGTQQFDSPENGLTPNTNTLVGKNGVIGIKTGSSTAALGNLVWAAEQRVGGVNQLIVGVTLSQPAVGSGPGQGILDQVLANSKKLVISAEQALRSHTVAHKGDVVGYLDDGLGGRVPVVATQDVQVTGWSGLSVDVSLQAEDKLPHSAAAGTVVGQLVVGSGATAQRIPVALQSDLAAPGFGAKLTRLA